MSFICRPSSSSSSIASSSSPKFDAKLNGKKRHRSHPPNWCCWIAFDIHPNFVYYVTIFDEDRERTKAVEPNMLAKSIWTSIKSFKTFRHQGSGWRMMDLTALFGYACALIDQQCVAGRGLNAGCRPPSRVPANAIIVVPTNCSLPYRMAVEEAAGAAGFGQVHLVCRATALAISYRMLYDEDGAAVAATCRRSTRVWTETAGGAQAAREERAEEKGEPLIVQLDDDDDHQQRGSRDKFVAILFLSEHCIQLTIYDFYPYHQPRLISSKVLHVTTDAKADIDLINNFLRRHLTAFHDKLFRLLTAGMPKLIGLILPTIRSHIAPSCQHLANCAVPSDMLAIFGIALKGVHLMLSSDDASADRSPLFLSRSMVPAFDYADNGEEEEGDDVDADDVEEQIKFRAEVEAIDEDFNKAFGLFENVASYREEGEVEGHSTTSTESDATLFDDQLNRGSAHYDEAEEAVLLDPILSRDKEEEGPERTGTLQRRQLTDYEKQLLADVITTTFVVVLPEEAVTAPSTTTSSDDNDDGGGERLLLATRDDGNNNNISHAAESDGAAENSAGATAAGNINNKMRWEETTDDEEADEEDEEGTEADEIETLGDDQRIIIDGNQQQQEVFFSSPDCQSSGNLSPRPWNTVNAEVQQTNDDDDVTITDTLDSDDGSSIGTTEPPVPVNRWGQPVDGLHQWTYTTYERLCQHPWQKKGGKSRNRAKRQQQQQQKATGMTPTAPPTAAGMVPERPSSRASTLQAMSDDDGDDDGAADGNEHRTVLANSSRRTPGYGGGGSDARNYTDNGLPSEHGGEKGRGFFSTPDDDCGGDWVDLLLPIFGAQRPVAGQFSARIEPQFYRHLPLCGLGELSSVQLVGLPLMWISNKFFQQEIKEWLRIRSGLKTTALINCFISFSVSASTAFRICRVGRFGNKPYNGEHNQLFVFALLPTPEVAWHVCWACNQLDDDLGKYWPAKYGQIMFKPTVTMANRQTFLEET